MLEEYDALGIPSLVANCDTSLRSSVSQPTSANADAFGTVLENLKEALVSCPSNTMVPTDHRILVAIGGVEMTGIGLERRLDTILSSTRVTPASASDQIHSLYTGLVSFKETLTATSNSLEELGIARDDLPGGETEIGVLLPTTLLDDEMGALGRELDKLNKHLRIFSELTNSTIDGFKLRGLASGSVNIYIQADASMAAAVIASVAGIVGIYKMILEIRLIHKQVEEKHLPGEVARSIKDYEKKRVREELEGLVTTIMKEHSGRLDTARRNELKNGLLSALKYLADRIDRGVDVEARTGPAPEAELPSEADAVKESGGKGSSLQNVIKMGSVVRSLERGPEPVLKLTEGESEDEQANGAVEKPKKRHE